MAADRQRGGYSFGTFQGVFTPSILTIIGVVMYLRFGWMLGNIGLGASLALVTLGSSITLLTGLSISALATNLRMRGGGAYFMLSRSFGPHAGAAVGLPLAASQAIGVSFYVAGFAEALVGSGLPGTNGLNPQIVGLATLTVLAVVSILSADLALKSQYFIMAAIVVSLVSFFCGSTPAALVAPDPQIVPAPLGIWPVFAVFFPAVTGILSGLGMSGDLRDPGKSIPRGTIMAVLCGYAIYMAVPIALDRFVSDPVVLRTDTMIFAKCARWSLPILLGVWAATLSSAVGSFLAAPRVLQALGRDGLFPAVFARGFGANDDPRVAAVACYALAACGILLGDINAIAPVLTMFNLSTYALLNLSAAIETTLDPPSWRPAFRVKSVFSYVGFFACIGAMLMISPGWTLIAAGCEALIFAIERRRIANPRWDDIRAGIYSAIARFALRRIERHRHDARNWMPELLVLTRMPIDNRRLLAIAGAIAGNRATLTVASVVPAAYCDVQRERGLKDSLERSARAAGLAPLIRVEAAEDVWEGMRGLVRTYGYGPLAPNTVVLGLPRDEDTAAFGRLVHEMVVRHRNAVMLDAGEAPVPVAGRCIDIWWRGDTGNAALMLALACLMKKRSPAWRKVQLRMNMIVGRRSEAEARETLAKFLEAARITAEIRVLKMSAGPFTDIIDANSADALVTFMGLRAPLEGETPAAYAGYCRHLRAAVPGAACPAFVLATEEVEFTGIFR